MTDKTTKNGPDDTRARQLGSLLGGGSLVLYGLSRRSLPGLGLAAAGSGLAYLGARSAKSQSNNGKRQAVQVQQAVTVYRPVAEVYGEWSNLENLSNILSHVTSVKTIGDGRSRWVAEGPGQTKVEWEAETTEEKQNEIIAWRSVGDSKVQNAGVVRFRQLPEGRGTEIHVALEYTPPAGVLGAALSRLAGKGPTQQIYEDLHRFKQLMEAGEIATTEGQPRGPASNMTTVEGRWRFGRQLIDTARTLTARRPATNDPQQVRERTA